MDGQTGQNLLLRTEYTTEILSSAPLILPARVYVFPKRVEEIERGALHAQVLRRSGVQPKLEGHELRINEAVVKPERAAERDGDTDDQRERLRKEIARAEGMLENERFVAVSGGYGYLVDVRGPERTVFLKEEPVVTALKSDAPEQLLLGTHRTVTAIDESGVAWTTAPLSSEGLSELRISGGELCGIGWDAVSDSDRAFRVDLISELHAVDGRTSDHVQRTVDLAHIGNAACVRR